MRIFFFITLLFILLTNIPAVVPAAMDDTIPSSKRSHNAFKRVSFDLIQEIQAKGHHLGDEIFIRIFKQPKVLEIWMRRGLTYDLFKTYPICYHSGKLGPKLQEGDKQSPEGFYSVTAEQLNPNSDYHLSFNLGYPNEYDRSHDRTGSLLMVHGSCSSAGCFAMTDYRMDEIYVIVESAIISGQHQVPVHIFPFRMTRKQMTLHKKSKWFDFWKNIKDGYDYFEGHHSPPVVTVADKRYNFSISRPLLFGGDLPPVPDTKDYAEIRNKKLKFEIF